ncbi:MAG: YgiQ family radical SAM protein [Methanimicrococcus sp.]|nr:YgiQ family radical SAM protein [Methanimicrococcus sp.]
MSLDEAKRKGWDELDIILISGDAYVDHSGYGTAIIGRVLEREGFRVGIIAQPDQTNKDDFEALGKPRLFFSVSAGNADSIVNNYTPLLYKRENDMYTAGGHPGLRPDRTVIAYSNRLRQAYPDVPIIAGGIEASLRRFAEYDYLSNDVRKSVLADAPIDLIVYGMGELQIKEIAKRLDANESISDITDIPGTVWKLPVKEWKNIKKGRAPVERIESPEFETIEQVEPIEQVESIEQVEPIGSVEPTGSIESIYSKSLKSDSYIELPDFETVAASKEQYAKTFKIIYENQNPVSGKKLVQPHPKTVIVQNPPMRGLTEAEMDEVYELPYLRLEHPSYEEAVPGLDVVRHSITSHRGCFGGCSFCAVTQHQGRAISNRSEESIIREAKALTEAPDFGGIINGIGGPSANMYGMTCPAWEKKGACTDKNCLLPEICPSLNPSHSRLLALLKRLQELPGVRKVLTGYGVRFDLALIDDGYLETLCAHHVGGQLKVAPEHFCDSVTAIMKKPNRETYERFEEKFKSINKECGLNQFLVTFQISGHPGCTLENAVEMAEYIRDRNRYTEQVQDFTPTPMTVSTCMFHTGLDPFTMEEIYVPVTRTEKKMQRALLQFNNPDNREMIQKALETAGREDLIGSGPKCLIPDERRGQRRFSGN